MLKDIIILIVAFCAVWLGSGLIISAVEKAALRLHASSFIVSFFLLGFITSSTEISVAINALANNEVEISIGNLLGGIIVLFLFVIPLLAVLGKGVKLNHELNSRTLLLCIVLLITPVILLLDKYFSFWEGIFIVGLYGGVGFVLYSEEKRSERILHFLKSKSSLDLFPQIGKIIIGSVILILSCNLLVEETIKFATELNVSPFMISLLGLAIGTNLPEISLAVRGALNGKNEVAFGNYVGSAAFNIFIMGILAVVSRGIRIEADFLKVSIFIVFGLSLFYVFARSRRMLDGREGLLLIFVYLLFLAAEVSGI